MKPAPGICGPRMKITNRHHPVVQACRSLAKARGAPGAVLLDGEHLIAEALGAGVRIHTLLALPGVATTLVGRVRAAGAVVYEATAGVIEAASPVRTPTGLVGVADWTPAGAAVVLRPAPCLAVGLVDVQDPGNVGAVIRAADALGATGVVAIGRTADPGGWKALRGAMGSTFRIPVARSPLEDIPEACQAGVRIVATVAAGGPSLESARFEGPTLLLLGNEGAGLSDEAVAMADAAVTVPMRAGVNSINVAVTAALLLYEARRQRSDRRR